MVVYKNKSFVTNSKYPDSDFMGNADWVVPDGSELAEKIKGLSDFAFVFDDDRNLVDVTEISEPIENIISQKKAELSEECEKAIIAGVDVGEAHYSLTIEDQANILALTPLAQAGNSVFYHQDGEMCREYSSDEFLTVVNAATVFKTLQTTYCNLLMRQVEAMTNAEEVRAVKYGVTELTGEFAERYEMIKATLIGDSGETNN